MRPLALGLAAFALLAAVAATVFLALSWSAPLPDAWGFRGYPIVIGTANAVVGVVVALRRRENPIGWLLLVAGALYCALELALEYAVFAVVGRTTPFPGGVFAAWLGSWLWTPIVIFVNPTLLVLFPDGRPPIRLLQGTFWASLVLATLTLLSSMALRPGPLQLAPYLDNPYALDLPILSALGPISIIVFLPPIVGTAVAVISRFRRARGVERAQLRWLAFAIVPYAILGPLSAILPQKIWQVGSVATQTFIPVAIGLAIVRYRLYDIDVIIRRTIIYGATSGAIAVAFFVGVVSLQALLSPITSGSEIAVAGSTLLSLALFQPLRTAVQGEVDRRFYRTRYDATRTVDDLMVRLRDQVDLDAVRGDLLASIDRTVQPSSVSLWLRESSR